MGRWRPRLVARGGGGQVHDGLLGRGSRSRPGLAGLRQLGLWRAVDRSGLQVGARRGQQAGRPLRLRWWLAHLGLLLAFPLGLLALGPRASLLDTVGQLGRTAATAATLKNKRS